MLLFTWCVSTFIWFPNHIYFLWLDETTEEKAEEVYNGFEYLVNKEHMGEKFKVLALISNNPKSNKSQAQDRV